MSNFNEPHQGYFLVRSMTGQSVEDRPTIEWGKSVVLPNCKVTVIKLVTPMTWTQVTRDVVGRGFTVYPLKCPGFPEHDGVVADFVIETLRAAAAGDRGIVLAVANEQKTVFEPQYATYSVAEHKTAGKRTF